jgi:hypothetical protein
MRHVLTAAAIAASAFLASFALPAASVRAQEPAVAQNPSDEGLDRVIQRVLAEGRRGYVSHATATILGFNLPSAANLDTTFEAFIDADHTVQHRIDAYDDGHAAILVAIVVATNLRTYYRCDVAGHLIAAVQGTKLSDAHALLLSAAKAGFEEQKAFWRQTLGGEN